MAPLPWTLRPDGLLLSIRLTPKSSRDALEGIEALSDGRAVVKARVRAVPEDGKANEALLKLVAKSLNIGKSAVVLDSGATARLKVLKISGDGLVLAARLLALLPPAKD